MLRKRASFKPNISRVAPVVAPVSGEATAEPQSETVAKEPEATQKPVAPVENSIADQQRINEAITQLTSQRLEPIKSINLRNSANKDVQLKDLLFFNPPLTKDQRRHRKSNNLKNKKKLLESRKAIGPSSHDKDADDKPKDNDADEFNLIPKVRMGPEGKLVLDESSTVINRKNKIKDQEAIIEDHEDIVSNTNYDSFRRKPSTLSQTKWSNDETQKFYYALTLVGSDFSMMESLIFNGHRSRTELHKKFKREERINKAKIDAALANRISISSEELDGLKDVFYK